nr:ATP-binding cassette domain-containing protein [Rhizobium sp. 16-449-1b]
MVIHDLEGKIAVGESLCVVGRNGVGKTTLVKTLFGTIQQQRGEIVADGKASASGGWSKPRPRRMSYCPQERPVFDGLTVHDNLTLMSGSRKLDVFEPFFAVFPILADRLRQQAGTLSGGEKKILAFTRTLSEGRPIVLLDEPSEGVQWENILKMAELINSWKQRGTAFVVVEQNLAFANLVADSYLVMDQGTVVLTGTRAQISRADIVEHLHI